MLLSQRTYLHRLIPVNFQHFSPEKNKYNYSNNVTRFKNSKWINIQLPFFGEWFVSQGYHGKITHKENWSEAIDFVVVDETKHTFKSLGTSVTDFYCYNLPVLAPADGYVVKIADGIEDNKIGDVDLTENWGNSIVIKHAEGLYSKLSHLKANSILVQLNDYVRAGQMLANCGSSGRSPEPHLHFQMQTTPFIGSATLSYQINHFISRVNEKYQFHENEIPEEGAQIHQPIKTPILINAFHFTPGQIITFETAVNSGNKDSITWDCMVDSWNKTYLYCRQTKAYAYFVNNGTTFYFTSYHGSKKSLLFDFYLAAYKILLGYYPDLIIKDSIDIGLFNHPISLWLQDMIAPFYLFKKVSYQVNFKQIDDMIAPTYIEMESKIEAYNFKLKTKERNYKLVIQDGKLMQIVINPNHKSAQKITCTN
jgi:hypothetical protein